MLDKHLPKTVDSPVQRAQQLKAAGDFAGARTILENELARDRENIDLQTGLAELQALDGDLDGARKELERLQGSQPTHAAVKTTCGAAFVQRHRRCVSRRARAARACRR